MRGRSFNWRDTALCLLVSVPTNRTCILYKPKEGKAVEKREVVVQEIEITPEMIVAGREALLCFDPEYLLDWEIVQSVYSAMEQERAGQD